MNAKMRLPFCAVLVCLLLVGCSETPQQPKPTPITDLIMPASAHAQLSLVERELVVDDVNDPPRVMPASIARTLKEAGVTAAANLTYTWGDPEGFLLIDVNLNRFSSPDRAKNNLLSRVGANTGNQSVTGLGDTASSYGEQSISFVNADLKVTLNAFAVAEGQIDLLSVAHAYDRWLNSTRQTVSAE